MLRIVPVQDVSKEKAFVFMLDSGQNIQALKGYIQLHKNKHLLLQCIFMERLDETCSIVLRLQLLSMSMVTGYKQTDPAAIFSSTCALLLADQMYVSTK